MFRRSLGLVPLVLIAAWLVAATVQAKPRLYYAGPGVLGIEQVNLDGTDPRPLSKAGDSPSDLKTDALRAYWSDGYYIGSVGLDGRNATSSLVNLENDRPGTLAKITALAVLRGYIYFAWQSTSGPDINSGTVMIGRVRSDGSAVQPELVRVFSSVPDPGLLGGIHSLAASGDYVYWADARTGYIGRAKLDGSDVREQFLVVAPNRGELSELAVSPRHIYWTEAEFIGRAGIDGSNAQPKFRRGYIRAESIAISAEYLYWGNSRAGSWRRMNLDGSDFFACFSCGIAGGGGVPHQIAILPGSRSAPAGRKCAITTTSVVRGTPLVASCRGLTGRVTITVARTLGAAAAAPSGSLVAQARFSKTIRNGAITLDTKTFCRDRYSTERYRILFTQDGYRNVGTATVRVRSGPIARRCR